MPEGNAVFIRSVLALSCANKHVNFLAAIVVLKLGGDVVAEVVQEKCETQGFLLVTHFTVPIV